MNLLKESNSDCSPDLKRRFPPTQIQSLSDHRSKGSNEIAAPSYSLESDRDLSADDEFDNEMGKLDNRERKLPSAFSDFKKKTTIQNYPRCAPSPFFK